MQFILHFTLFLGTFAFKSGSCSEDKNASNFKLPTFGKPSHKLVPAQNKTKLGILPSINPKG